MQSIENKIISSTKRIFTLLKFAKREHLEQLQQGYLYMNQIRYFKDLANDPQRGDKFEGAIACLQPGRTRIVLTNPKTGEEVVTESDELYLHDNNLLDSHIYCLYAIHSGEYHDKLIDSEQAIQGYTDYLKLNQDKEEFGGHVLYFTKPDELFKRLETTINSKNLFGKRGRVSFFDENSHQGGFPENMHGFLKPLSYQHQNEYRLLIKGLEASGPHKLHIGNLSDISEITTVQQFNDSLKIEMPTETSESTE